jgi:hypothetical protein
MTEMDRLWCVKETMCPIQPRQITHSPDDCCNYYYYYYYYSCSESVTETTK